jgi:20S proteasome subunit beta 4
MKAIATTYSLFLLLCSPLIVRASSAAGQETLIGIKGKDFLIFGADSSTSSSITVTSSSIDKIKLISNPFPNGIQGDKTGYGVQHVIAVASAGESADCERLVCQLSLHATQIEYENGLGSDVQCVFHDGQFEKGKYSSECAGLDAEAIAYFARDSISKAMRTRNRMSACLLIGGMVPNRDAAIVRDHVEFNDIPKPMKQDVPFSERIQAQVEAATRPLTLNVNNKNAQSNTDISDTSQSNEYEPKLFWLDEYGSLQIIDYGAHGLGSNFALSILDRGYKKDMTREEAVTLIHNCFDQLRTRFVINNPENPCIKCVDCDGCKQY